MKEIKVGETNDLHLFAISDGHGGYYPLGGVDLQYERPDAKIYYDSGVYPGVTNLEKYICGKARKASV